MRVVLARTAGFCMGVRRALDLVLREARRRRRPVRTEGPLIHNPQVVALLEQLGVGILDQGALPAAGSTVVLRAHGVPPARRAELAACLGAELVDATCPLVERIQELVRRGAAAGRPVLVVGDADHPEVATLLACAGATGRCLAAPPAPGEVPAGGPPPLVVAQSTMDLERFAELARQVQARRPDAEVRDTICRATRQRQEEVRELCRQAEAVVVVGGRNSANTRRLAEIARACGRLTLAVETEADLDARLLAGCSVVAVTAGASTPNWLILRVVRALESLPGGRSRLRRAAGSLLEFLVDSCLFLAVGAAGMTLALGRLQGLTVRWPVVGAASGYLFSMHLINHYTDPAAEFRDPRRGAFFRAHRRLLVRVGLLALVFALAAAFRAGETAFLFACGATVLGALYNVPLLPRGWGRLGGLRGLNDLPASRDAAIALAWAGMAGLLPALAAGAPRWPASFLAAALAAGVVLVRNLEVGLAELQGDQLVGKETLPVLAGEKFARRLSPALLAAVLALLVLLPLAGGAERFCWWLVPAVLWLGVALLAGRRAGLGLPAWRMAALEFGWWLFGLAALLRLWL